MRRLLAIAACPLFVMPLHSEGAKLTVSPEVRKAVFFAENEAGWGTGFACSYRDREFVATNLHVASGASQTAFKTQDGATIALGQQMILAGDADICLYSVAKPFSGYGVEPLEFVSNVVEETSIGDDVVCLGNSLGNGVIIQSDGEIKAYGSPSLETTTAFVGGNSGGPLVHHKTGKVIGLLTETKDNRSVEAGTVRDEAAVDDEKSELSEISYLAHRIDTVKQWRGTSTEAFLKAERTLQKHAESIDRTILFLVNEEGWRSDQDLAGIWDQYSQFIDEAAEKTSRSVKVTEYVNEFGAVVRRDVRVRKKTVSQADYDKAYERFLRGLDWKIKADERGLKKLVPLGYIQKKRREALIDDLSTVRNLFEKLQTE